MSEILIRDNRDPLFGLGRDAFLSILRRQLTGRIQSAWIFGSFATDSMSPSSDIDLILVKETAMPFLQRGEEFFDLLDIGPAIDILVYTPEEFQKLTQNPSLGFWKSVVTQMIRIL